MVTRRPAAGMDQATARSAAKFINSDPGMLILYVRWLRMLGIPGTQLSFRVTIHETADAAAAVAYWSNLVGVPPSRFLRTTLKRHRPRTGRKNVGDAYFGCLIVSVRRSVALNSRIRGWFQGIVANLPEELGQLRPDERRLGGSY